MNKKTNINKCWKIWYKVYIKNLIKNKFGIWLIFSAFLTEEDKKYFIFKNAENLFPKGQYGFFVNKIKKDAVKRFLTFVEENKEIFKIQNGIYSDEEFVNPLLVINKKYPNAVIHYPDSMAPFICKNKVIITIHDLAFKSL